MSGRVADEGWALRAGVEGRLAELASPIGSGVWRGMLR
jgi:hypothetical protein